MQHKLVFIFCSVLALVSMQAVSQTIDTLKSVHPKMDKYYPQPPKIRVIYATDSNSVTPTRPVTQVQPAPVMTTAPASQNTVVNSAPEVTPTPPAETEIPPSPAVTSTPVTVEPSNTTVDNSNTVTKPAAVTINKPPIQAAPTAPTSNYVDPSSLFTTRLGSSSPQYDTWKKNDDGAGSVTTHSK